MASGELVVRFVPQAEVRPQLTDRQAEILDLMADGLTTKEIAARMICAPDTVKNHTVALFRKFGVGTRHGLVAKAFRLGMLT